MWATSENKQSEAKRKRRARAVLLIWEEGSGRKKKLVLRSKEITSVISFERFSALFRKIAACITAAERIQATGWYRASAKNNNAEGRKKDAVFVNVKMFFKKWVVNCALHLVMLYCCILINEQAATTGSTMLENVWMLLCQVHPPVSLVAYQNSLMPNAFPDGSSLTRQDNVTRETW